MSITPIPRSLMRAGLCLKRGAVSCANYAASPLYQFTCAGDNIHLLKLSSVYIVHYLVGLASGAVQFAYRAHLNKRGWSDGFSWNTSWEHLDRRPLASGIHSAQVLSARKARGAPVRRPDAPSRIGESGPRRSRVVRALAERHQSVSVRSRARPGGVRVFVRWRRVESDRAAQAEIRAGRDRHVSDLESHFRRLGESNLAKPESECPRS